MKQVSFYLALAFFFFLGVHTLNAETIKGNGKIVTQEVNVVNFDEVLLSVPATVDFTQGDQYSCSITIDENLLPYISFKVVGDDLFIRQLPSKDGKPLLSFNFGEKEVSLPLYKFADLEYTKFIINITAPNLEDVKVKGSGIFNMANDFSAMKLNVNVDGSGEFMADKLLDLSELDLMVVGSGSAKLMQLSVSEADVIISGSGAVKLSGTFTEIDFKVAGSGNIDMTGTADKAKAEIAGSGNIHLGDIRWQLKYKIAGSGSIYYAGKPELKGFVAGSGSIRSRGNNRQ